MLLCAEDGGLCLVEVVHRLDEDKVRPGLLSDLCHLSEQGDRLLKGEVSEGLEELSRGADVDGDVRILPAAVRPGLLCDLYGRGGAEGVGVYDVRSCLQIPAVQVVDVIFPGQVPGLGELSSLEALCLQDGAGRTVAEEPRMAESF